MIHNRNPQPSNQQPRAAAPQVMEGTCAKLPLVNLDDISFDELCSNAIENPSWETAARILNAPAGQDDGSRQVKLTHANSRLLHSFHHHQNILKQRGVTLEEA